MSHIGELIGNNTTKGKEYFLFGRQPGSDEWLPPRVKGEVEQVSTRGGHEPRDERAR